MSKLANTKRNYEYFQYYDIITIITNERLGRPEQATPTVFERIKNFGQFVINQLRDADLNPHEGKLRNSVAPEEHIQKQIPDHPPLHDDTIS